MSSSEEAGELRGSTWSVASIVLSSDGSRSTGRIGGARGLSHFGGEVRLLTEHNLALCRGMRVLIAMCVAIKLAVREIECSEQVQLCVMLRLYVSISLAPYSTDIL
jgi:hypothetical protein